MAESSAAAVPTQGAELTAAVGRSLSARVHEVATDMREAILESLPDLRSDERIAAALTASVEAEALAIFHILQGTAPLDEAEAPGAAIGYARQLAQHGVPVFELIRAYRVGHERLLRSCFRELITLFPDRNDAVPDAMAEIVRLTFRYADRTAEQVVTAHEVERDRWSHARGAVRAAAVRQLLAEQIDVSPGLERTLGYRLHQRHVGVVAWSRGEGGGRTIFTLERAITGIARHLGSDVGNRLFIPYDDTCAWAWLPASSVENHPPASLEAALTAFDPPVRVAVGDAAAGIEGFRKTHIEALRAHAVALAGGARHPRLTRFADIAPIAALPQDLDFAQNWIRTTLGPLATPIRRWSGCARRRVHFS